VDIRTVADEADQLVKAFNPVDCEEDSELEGLVVQLAALTVLEGRRRGFNSEETFNIWQRGIGRISELQWVLQPDGAARTAWERRYQHVFWPRYSVQAALAGGDSSPEYFDVNRASIEKAAASYFETPWLSHPAIDFAIADALITSEICSFGETVKDMPSGGIINTVIVSMAREKAAGRTDRLYWEILKLRAQAFFYIYVLPIGVLWWISSTYHADWALGLAICWGAFYLIRLAYRTVKHWVRRVLKMELPQEKCSKLWAKMANVHRLLDGGTLAPSVIKAELATTRNEGAVWSQTIDVILDRRSAAPGGRWIVSPSFEGLIDERSGPIPDAAAV